MTLESVFEGPKRGADRAVLLAHGAGADMEAPALVAVAAALVDADVPVLRFNFPYRSAGHRTPDRAPVLDAAVREAAADLARRTQLPPDRLVLGGRSMGGRYCSMAVAAEADPVPARGLLLLGYPLHPAGKPEKLRTDHFPRLRVPCLFVSGTRDALASRDALLAAARRIRGPVDDVWIDGADHGFRVAKASGTTTAEVLARVAAVSVEWVATLPAGGERVK
ncbi:MAG: dienelactone hydrolase [Actinobacteria bacterium]|nr:dienelactone hydrolase [Actinomycetota bacterium]